MRNLWHLFTDGACNNNSNQRGGWAFIVKDSTQNKVHQVGFGASGKADTTSNRMELFAIYAALKHTPTKDNVLIHTDSMYCHDALTKWHYGWQVRNWKTITNTEVMNRELIQKILFEMSQFNEVTFQHVPRNSTPEMNWVDNQAKTGKSMVDYYIGELPVNLPIIKEYKKPPDCKKPYFIPGPQKKQVQAQATDKPPRFFEPLWPYKPGMRLTNNSTNNVKIIQLLEPLKRVSYSNSNGWRIRIVFASGKKVNMSVSELTVDSLNKFYIPCRN